MLFVESITMRKATSGVAMAVLCAVFAFSPGVTAPAATAALQEEYQTEFNLPARSLTHTGESTYFILIPGYQLVLDDGQERVTITVLNETREINGITTRIVEEREEEFGELGEVSRNFFALDAETGDVFYFGEDVDIYEGGEIVRSEGAWLAYRDGDPGMLIPGTPVVGMRYYQEQAPDVALDRAEIVSISDTISTPAGVFSNVLLVWESSPLEPDDAGVKAYAPGIGMVRDESLRLVSYGYAW
jgi:hypothetical protein